MKVLQLGKYYFPYRGGIETHLKQLSEGISANADVTAVVCNSKHGTVREQVGPVPVVRCSQVAFAASTSICPSMAWELSRSAYDLIHFHFPHPMGVVAYLASKKPRKHKVVVSYHSDVVKQALLLKAYRPVMHQLLRRADAIVAATEAYAETSADLQPYRSKLRIIPYGVDPEMQAVTEDTRRIAGELRAKFPGPLVLAVGRLVYYKGFEFLLRAMKHVKATLLLVGVGPLRETLGNLAHELGVEARVHFLGAAEGASLGPYYLAAEVFVLPSIARSEAFAIVQLEAMAAGIPVVNTALDSGVPHVSLDNVTGLTVEPKNPQALAVAIQRLLDDPALRARMGEAGRDRVAKEFSEEVMLRKMRALYSELTGMAL